MKSVVERGRVWYRGGERLREYGERGVMWQRERLW